MSPTVSINHSPAHTLSENIGVSISLPTVDQLIQQLRNSLLILYCIVV